jgi:hypothetical protein
MALHHTETTDFAVDPIEPLLGVDRAAHLLGISETGTSRRCAKRCAIPTAS